MNILMNRHKVKRDVKTNRLDKDLTNKAVYDREYERIFGKKDRLAVKSVVTPPQQSN